MVKGVIIMIKGFFQEKHCIKSVGLKDIGYESVPFTSLSPQQIGSVRSSSDITLCDLGFKPFN